MVYSLVNSFGNEEYSLVNSFGNEVVNGVLTCKQFRE